MERIEYKVLIMSNKGGVGKSTCTTNLAVSLALKGWHVGICDMDIHGPNIPKMVGAEGQKLKISTSGGIIPFQAYNLKIASMSFLLQNPDDPIIWRDAYKYEFINQLLGGVEWQDLNFLLIDLPPGTGNESVTTIDLLGNVSGAVIVTTPQEVALLDSRKSVSFCKDSEVPIIGIVENMSGLECPHCHTHIEVFRKGGGEASAMDMGVPFLGRIPLDTDVIEALTQLQEAQRVVLESTPILGVEKISILDALGRVLGEDIVAERDNPPWDNSAMDGFAVRWDDIRQEHAIQKPVSLTVIEDVPAGKMPAKTVGQRQAI